MRTANLIATIAFVFAGWAGALASAWWKWVPDPWVVSTIAFVALTGAASESVFRQMKK